MRTAALILMLGLGAGTGSAQWIWGKAQPGRATKAAAEIDGTIHTISKKEIGIERDGNNVMVMSIGRKTKFVENGKPSDWKAFHSGDEVKIQAEEDFPGHFAAVVVSMKSTPPPRELQER